jgi:hypothetical protein
VDEKTRSVKIPIIALGTINRQQRHRWGSFSPNSTPRRFVESPPLPQSEFLCVLDVVDLLHRLFRGSEARDSSPHDSNLTNMVSSCTNPEIADIVNEIIRYHLCSSKAEVISGSAFVGYPFTNEKQSWLMVHWRETNGRDVMAVFDLEGNAERCNYVIHYGSNWTNYEGNNHCWETSLLLWNVNDISSLKTIFQGVQHILGVLELPKHVAEKLYCGNLGGCSKEEYVSRCSVCCILT